MTDLRARPTAVLAAAAKAKSEAKAHATDQAIRRLVKRGEPVTFQAVNHHTHEVRSKGWQEKWCEASARLHLNRLTGAQVAIQRQTQTIVPGVLDSTAEALNISAELV